jgi:hypothetical protein
MDLSFDEYVEAIDDISNFIEILVDLYLDILYPSTDLY